MNRLEHTIMVETTIMVVSGSDLYGGRTLSKWRECLMSAPIGTLDLSSSFMKVELLDEILQSLSRDGVRVRRLRLDYNRLRYVPEDLCWPSSLTSLHMSSCYLYSLPENIGSIAGLSELILVDNKLSCLPDSLENLTKLTILDISRNKFREYPEFLRKYDRCDIRCSMQS